MSIVKSFSVDNGDMFYIKHGSDNFTLIDCFMPDNQKDEIIKEIQAESRGKGVVRFISTHPDGDHISGLKELNEQMNFLNFYCVKNEATKEDETTDFEEYCALRDDQKKAFYLHKGCSRKWMNRKSDENDDYDRGSSGINILWPITGNANYKEALQLAKDGNSPNNISPIIRYGLGDGASIIWMGDLETDFMGLIKDEITMDAADILFAPHHGRDKVPTDWLNSMNPKIIIIGEAPSANLNYYDGYNTITQNSAGDIVLDCDLGKTHIYVSSNNYSVDFLDNETMPDVYGNYIGTLTQ